MGRQSRETTELQCWRFPLYFCWQWLPRLPLRQMPRLRLTPICSTVGTMAMASAMDTAMDIPMATTATTERGVLMPSLRPRLIPTFFMVDTTDRVWATATATDTPTDTDTTARGVLMLIPLLLPPLSDTPMPFLMPPQLSPPPSPSPTRPSPPLWRPTLLPPTLLSPLLLEATRPLPVTTVS